MSRWLWRLIGIAAAVLLFLPPAAHGTDVDGPNDCVRTIADFGDAPEDYPAYPGVIGRFPTCTVPSAPGTLEAAAGCPPLGTLPGATGVVIHWNNPDGYWLGCPPAALPMGIDQDLNGKTSPGLPNSVCDNSPVDCFEAAFGLSFGQDECAGGNDAGVQVANFKTCTQDVVRFSTYNCGPPREAFLNILIDMNQDGDWNDTFLCPGGICANEWAVSNAMIQIGPGCTVQLSPPFIVGPNAGHAWMRVSISDEPVPAEFPWRGSEGLGRPLAGGETEDYPLEIEAAGSEDPCGTGWEDFGDAPEDLQAYASGVPGRFPTCMFAAPPGTQEIQCGIPLSTPPGPTGFVRHVAPPLVPPHFWLGCPSGPNGPWGVDREADGKVSLFPMPPAPSHCNPAVFIDCSEAALGVTYGQDECTGDVVDAGIVQPVQFATCSTGVVAFSAYACTPADVYLNILVDWNEDGDWNDNLACTGPVGAGCAHEWVVKNQLVTLAAGCQTLTSPAFLTGPRPGQGWMRVTLTPVPVLDDFPWNGSAGVLGESYEGGETEDYPVTIREQIPGEPCETGYIEYGDAPEDLSAYSSGIVGHFPTCRMPTAAGTQELQCGTPSAPPAATGFVAHLAVPMVGPHFWLGCPSGVGLWGVDGEKDGKVNLLGAIGSPSFCDPTLQTDAVEPAFGWLFDQDEAYGDADAGVASWVQFVACSTNTVTFRTFACTAADVYLNVLVDWNEDGDWNDNLDCPPCAPEWVVKNVVIPLAPGCQTMTSPAFLGGPRRGEGWMRITLTSAPVPDDFPWNGSAGVPGEMFENGETEDYPVSIREPVDPCDFEYEDFGDAPEMIQAYPGGMIGLFPTCLTPGAIGTQSAPPCTLLSTPPGPAGYVQHRSAAADPFKVWLGCGMTPAGGIDSEPDGKMNLGLPLGGPSACAGNPTDCIEIAWGMLPFNQDECTMDGVDAGLIPGPTVFTQSRQGFVHFQATNCRAVPVTAYLNILVDWNQDGDWNDVLGPPCAHEWAVRNHAFTALPGCPAYVSPGFPVGHIPGPVWMRITITPTPVPPDFPWAGSATMPGGFFTGGETEDYPMHVEALTGAGPRAIPEKLGITVVPNPSWEAVTIRLALPRSGPVAVGVFDITGRRLCTLADGEMPAGEHALPWNFRSSDGAEVPPGYYVIKMRAGDRVVSRSVVRVR